MREGCPQVNCRPAPLEAMLRWSPSDGFSKQTQSLFQKANDHIIHRREEINHAR